MIRLRRRPRQIDPAFARVLASQVAIGLARNAEPPAEVTPSWVAEIERAAGRARASLVTIGLMLSNACPDDEVVATTLDMAEHLTVRDRPGGGVEVSGRVPRS